MYTFKRHRRILSALLKTRERVHNRYYRHKFTSPPPTTAMPYLRGSRRQSVKYAKGPTLANKVASLQSQVSKNKPELQSFRALDVPVTAPPGIGATAFNLELTRLFIDDANFRTKVTGDKWRNVFLKFNLSASDFNMSQARIIVYISKQPGSILTGTNFDHIYDPTAYTVLSDSIFVPNTIFTRLHGSAHVNLGSRITSYNSDADAIDRNAIKVYVMYQWDGLSGGTTCADYSWELKFRNM